MNPNFHHPNRRQLLAGLTALAATGTAGNALAQAAK